MTTDTKPSKDTPKRSAPTDKMLAAAKRAAERHGVPLPQEAEDNFEACRQFLDTYINKPSDKQISFAQKLAEENGVEVPAELMTDAKGLSAWIDQHISK